MISHNLNDESVRNAVLSPFNRWESWGYWTRKLSQGDPPNEKWCQECNPVLPKHRAHALNTKLYLKLIKEHRGRLETLKHFSARGPGLLVLPPGVPRQVQGSRMLEPRLGFIWRRRDIGYQGQNYEQRCRISTKTPNGSQCEALQTNTRVRWGGRCGTVYMKRHKEPSAVTTRISGIYRHTFQPLSPHLAPWGCHVTSLSLSFLIGKMRAVIPPRKCCYKV